MKKECIKSTIQIDKERDGVEKERKIGKKERET